MLDKYKRLVDACRPYAVLNTQVRPFCDLEPLGLAVAPDQLLSPYSRTSGPFLNALQWLDRMTFGFSGMEMPRWVFYDCSEMPGGICGFTVPIDTLPPSLFRGGAPPKDYNGPMPVSMAIAIPMIPEGCWLEHTLCSINELNETAAPAGLRTVTFAMALSLFRVRTLYGTTQWRSSELRVHTKFGELELLTAYTPAHTEPRTLTYRFKVTPERLQRALSGRAAYADPPADAVLVDVGDSAELIRVQRDIESGHKVLVCGRPIRDGSSTLVPLRWAAP